MESIGLCRCCLAEGLFKDMAFEYIWMNDNEVYADMLLETLDISITLHTESLNGLKRLICETCICRLREASNFKKQVLDSEKQFLNMLRKGKLKPSWQNTQLNIKLEAADDADIDDDTYLEDLHFSVGIKKNKTTEVKSEMNLGAKRKSSRTQKKSLNQGEVKTNVAACEVKGGLFKSSLSPKSSKSRRGVDREYNVRLNRKALNLGGHLRSPSEKEDSHHPKRQIIFYFIRNTDKEKHNLLTILKYSNVTPFNDRTLLGYLCGYCKDTFPDPQDLRTHTAMEHSKVRLDFQSRVNHNEQSVKFDITDLICTICNQEIENLKALKDHLVKSHQQHIFDGIANYLLEFRLKKGDQNDCASCPSTYETFKMLKQHMNIHYPNFVCDVCSSPFITKRSLFSHKRRHIDGNFKCSHCEKVFASNDRKLYHEKLIHNRRKINNKCGYCDLIFDNHYKRNLHLLNDHKVDPMYKCNICERTFLTKALLTRHTKRDHLMERNFKCTECDYRSFRHRQLLNHMLTHSGERNYVCDVCSKAYGRKSTLREHMRIHNNDRRFKCQECGLKFVQKCSLRGHLLTTHNISLAAS
ncbi:hypothetical protein ACJJTC_000406 [Scirpophaga incertulas]